MHVTPINTVENTPTHCHSCHAFVDCKQAQNMVANTLPVEGWVCGGDVYCADCLQSGQDGFDEYPYSGESDSPTHCTGCGVPIIHDLTAEGVEYLREALADGGGCCAEVWPTVWADYLVWCPYCGSNGCTDDNGCDGRMGDIDGLIRDG